MKQLVHGGDWMGYRERFGRDALDFSANVSPLGLPEGVAQAIREALAEADRYPDPLCRTLRAALSRAEGVPPEQILCGNGAADLIFRLVWAAKPRRALVTLLERFAAPDAVPILFTRLSEDVFNALPLSRELRSALNYDALSRTAWFKKNPLVSDKKVAVVSAGTADGFVTREITRTLEFSGRACERFEDCGVAGLWRIEAALPAINACDCVVVVAGLDAALASVLGGLTEKPLFAVPTSVGYGVAQSGMTAMSSMLASCAPGVAVLNIDNGYGAACAAIRVLRALDKAAAA